MLKTVSDILTPHFDVVAAVTDGRAALNAAALENPDVALLDIAMPVLDGIQAAREITHRTARTKIVFLTGLEDDDYVSEALTMGAQGYVFKRRMQSDLVPAVNLALNGHFFVSPYGFCNPELVVPRPGPAVLNLRYASIRHIMEFYSDEFVFLRGASEFVRASLEQDKVVVALLKREYLTSLSQHLTKSGIDLKSAIKWRDYRPFAVDATLPFLMPKRRLDRARFTTFFEPMLARSGRGAQRKCSGVVVLSDLASALMDLGYDHENALQAEQLWNDLVQRWSLHVHCVCRVTSLGAKRNRETLAQICSQHSRVIPIDHAKCGRALG